MLQLLTTRVLMWGCAGLLGALLVVGSFAGCEHHNAKAARAERDQARGQLAETRVANVSNQQVIASQNKALDQWAAIAISPQDVMDLVHNLTEAKKEADATIKLLRSAKEADNALPECVALLRLSLRDRCPSIAAGLLKLQAAGEHRAGGDPGAGPEAATVRSDGGLRAEVSIPR